MKIWIFEVDILQPSYIHPPPLIGAGVRVTFDCACNWKGRGVGLGVRSLAWLGTDWIALPGERFESFFLGGGEGGGDIYIPVPVIGGGERWWCRWSGHSWVALSDGRFES